MQHHLRPHLVPLLATLGILAVSVSAWVILTTDITLPTFSIKLPNFSGTSSFESTETNTTDEKPAEEEKTETPIEKPTTKPADVATPVETNVEETSDEPINFATDEEMDGTLPQLIARGNAALKNNQAREAVAAFVAAADLAPKDTHVLLRLADAQILAGDRDAALKNVKAAEKNGADAIEVARRRGQIFLKEQKFSDADEAFTAAGDGAAYERGLLAAFFDRQDEARRLLQMAASGGDAIRANTAHLVIAAYEEFALFPEGQKSHLDTLLARAFNNVGHYELAAAKITPVLDGEPEFRDAWLLLGYARLALKEYDAAIEAFETAYHLDPAMPETSYFLGVAYAAKKEMTSAAHYFELAIGNGFKKQDDARRRLADAYFALGDTASAMPLYAELAAKAGSADAYIRPIFAYVNTLRDGTSAWHLASEALARFPESAMAHNLAGWVSVANGYLPEARSYLTRAATLNPELAAPHLNLGWYFEKSGDIDAAKASYKKAFDLDSAGSIGREAAERYNRLVK